MKKGFTNIVFILGIIVLVVIVALFIAPKHAVPPRTEQPVACTMEAKLCPDGSSVGRSGPNCEFAACPSISSETTTIYQGHGFSLQYPVNTLVYASNSAPADSITFTNKRNATSPLELPDDGILVEAAVYPASAKTGLISDVQKILAASLNVTVVHPITPYPNKYIKVRNLSNNGFLLKSTEDAKTVGSREIESAFWLKDNKVYQLRLVVVREQTFLSFEESFNTMVANFSITTTQADIKRKATVESILRSSLELYRADYHKYPTSLEELVPKYIAIMPLDPITGQKYSYKASSTQLDYAISTKLDTGLEYTVTAPK